MPRLKSSVIILGVIIISLYFNYLVLAAVWTEPSSTPPGGNVPAPLNISSAEQWKIGEIGVGCVSPCTTGPFDIPSGGIAASIFYDKENFNNYWINPTGTSVFNLVKITGGIPGVSKVLTSDANGLASWGSGAQAPTFPLYPDGFSGITPVTMEISMGGSYTVPAGKNLYLLHCSGGSNIAINGIVSGVGCSPSTLNPPLIVGSGQTLSTSAGMQFNGYLVNGTAQAITINIPLNGSYTVPAGKNLYMLYCNGMIQTIGTIYIGLSCSQPLNPPLIVGSGQTLFCSSPMQFTGYLTPQ